MSEIGRFPNVCVWCGVFDLEDNEGQFRKHILAWPSRLMTSSRAAPDRSFGKKRTR